MEDTAVSFSSGAEEITAMDADPDKNIMAGGIFTNSIPGVSFSALGGADIMVQFLDRDRNQNWTTPFRFRSSGGDDRLTDVEFNPVSNSYYITGQLDGNLTILSAQFGQGSFFLTEINQGGSTPSVGWMFPSASGGINNSVSRGAGITTDPAGDIYVLGEFEDSIVLSPTLTLYDSEGDGDLFLAKFSGTGGTKGDLLQAIRIVSKGSVQGVDLGYDKVNNRVVIGANYKDTVIFSSTDTLFADSSGQSDFLVARYSNTLTYVNSTAAIHSKDDIVAYGFDVDTTGASVATGYFEGSYTAGSFTENAQGGKDIFVIKVGNAGTVTWATNFGGSSDEGGRKVAIDTNSKIYILGQFETTVNFGTVDTVINKGQQDGWLLTLDNAGAVLGAKGGIMQTGNDVLTPLAFALEGDTLWFGGDFFGIAKFGTRPAFSSRGFQKDAFIAQVEGPTVFCNVDTSLSITDFRLNGSDLHVCDGDSGLMSTSVTGNVTFQWFKDSKAIAGATTTQLHVDSGEYITLSLPMW
ncbi:hypothetical protein KFE98_12180 [bacterium SCSIO 12741]|nr:hypothetical protein KFE98_12180 [bacterium SCSIO 12741]